MPSSIARLDRVTVRCPGKPGPGLYNVSLAIYPAEILAIAGTHGAGKNNISDVLLGLRLPDEGSVELFGDSPRNAGARKHVGALPVGHGLPEGMTVRELVHFVQSHYPRALPVRQLQRWFGIWSLADEEVESLDDENARRLALALAFCGDPDLVLLDEPGSGLDQHWRQRLWQAMRAHRQQQRTVVFSTYELQEAQAVADRLILLDAGRVIAGGSTQGVFERAGWNQEISIPDGQLDGHTRPSIDELVSDLTGSRS